MNLNFKSIQIDRQEEYQACFKACPQKASDYSFVNLWGWSEEYGLSWAFDSDLVWIRQSIPEQRYWSPIGPWDKVDWKETAKKVGLENICFYRMPEMLVNILLEKWLDHSPHSFEVIEARGDWDYIYLVSDLVELKGNKFHKKKNLLNQFEKLYMYQYIQFEKTAIEKAIGMQEDWCTWRDCESTQMLASENRVIAKILSHWDQLHGLMGGALIIEDKMVAYTLAEALADDMLVIHFEKGSQGYKGIYQAINQMFLSSLDPLFTWVNREQDIDDPGLRKAKLSYNPVDFIKKYQVRID